MDNGLITALTNAVNATRLDVTGAVQRLRDMAKLFGKQDRRLIRIESKLVRGFEELGVNIDEDANWLTVDEPGLTVYISTLGRSATVMLTDMKRQGARQVGKWYTVVHKGEEVMQVCYRPPVF